jgi:hypothetical protein
VTENKGRVKRDVNGGFGPGTSVSLATEIGGRRGAATGWRWGAAPCAQHAQMAPALSFGDGPEPAPDKSIVITRSVGQMPLTTAENQPVRGFIF